jgi:hypothetical protein
MPRFSFPVFLWLFAVGNAVVWFGIAFVIVHLIAHGLSPTASFSRAAALWTICIAPLFANVLAVQGSIVNLRVQYLEGRFDLPEPGATAPAPLRNPWRVAAPAGWLLCLPGIPIALAVSAVALPQPVPTRTVGFVLGTFVALSVLVASHRVSAHELRSFAARLGQRPAAPSSAGSYLLRHLALPWALVNLILNGILGYLAYSRYLIRSPAVAPLAELRTDLAVTGLLLALLIGLAAAPEAECDAVTGAVELPAHESAMPSFAKRIGLAAVLAASVWLLMGVAAQLVRTDHVGVWTAVTTKAVFTGGLAAASAWLHGRWSLSGARIKHARWMSP